MDVTGKSAVDSRFRPAPPVHNGPAVAALVLGIVAVFLLVTGPQLLSLVLGIAAVVAGFVGWRRAVEAEDETAGRGMGIAGIVLGCVPLVVALIALSVRDPVEELYDAPRSTDLVDVGNGSGMGTGDVALSYLVDGLSTSANTWSVEITIENRGKRSYPLSTLEITAKVDHRSVSLVANDSGMNALASGELAAGEGKTATVTFTGHGTVFLVGVWPRQFETRTEFLGNPSMGIE